MPEITLQPAGAAGIDTYIQEDNPAVNQGGLANMFMGWPTAPAPNNHDILMKFDLSFIPPGSIIEAATLSLWLEWVNLGAPGTCFIARILAGNFDWTEMGCTWNTKDGANPWAGSAGCETSGVDIAGAPLWTGIPGVGVGAFHDFDLDPTAFQAFLDVGNYGFKYYAGDRNPTVVRHMRYTSSDGAAAQRPKLYIRWREPAIRLVEYSIDVWDEEEKIIDSQGRVIAPDEVEANKFINLIGAGKASSIVYDDLIANPLISYIESVSYRMNSNKVKIRASKESMLQSFLTRLSGMTS